MDMVVGREGDGGWWLVWRELVVGRERVGGSQGER